MDLIEEFAENITEIKTHFVSNHVFSIPTALSNILKYFIEAFLCIDVSGSGRHWFILLLTDS